MLTENEPLLTSMYNNRYCEWRNHLINSESIVLFCTQFNSVNCLLIIFSVILYLSLSVDLVYYTPIEC